MRDHLTLRLLPALLTGASNAAKGVDYVREAAAAEPAAAPERISPEMLQVSDHQAMAKDRMPMCHMALGFSLLLTSYSVLHALWQGYFVRSHPMFGRREE